MFLFLSCSRGEKNGEPKQKRGAIKVETQIVRKVEPDEALDYTGAIIPIVSVPLSFKLVGTVSAINVDVGDAVRANQFLAAVDKISYESSYKSAVAAQHQAQDAYNRLKKVYDKGSLPEIKWEEAQAKLKEANAAEKIAKRNLENCELSAPSSGVIGKRELEVGANTTPGIPVFELVEIQDVYVKIAVPENEISKVKKGQKARVVIKATGNEQYEAIVEKIGVVANMVSKTYEVKLRMKNPGLTARPGMVCDVDLKVGKQDEVIAIPYQAVITEGDKSIVYVVNKQQKIAQKRDVSTGNFINNKIEIVTGLAVGDEVVIHGQHKLKYNKVEVEI